MSILVTTTKTGTLRARAKPRCSEEERGREGWCRVKGGNHVTCRSRKQIFAATYYETHVKISNFGSKTEL